MTNYREILRLSSLGLNKTQIAQSVGCSRTTVIQVLNIAEEKGISYPLPPDLSDRKLSELLFPSTKAQAKYKMPDYEYVGKELRKSGVTLNLLWLEYCEECRKNGELPYQLTQSPPKLMLPCTSTTSPARFFRWTGQATQRKL